MPLYDYDCSACGRRFEVVHGVHAEGPSVCPICGSGPIRKAIAAPAVHFKGTGWAKKERRATATPGASKPSADASSESGSKVDESGSLSATVTGDKAKPIESGAGSKAD